MRTRHRSSVVGRFFLVSAEDDETPPLYLAFHSCYKKITASSSDWRTNNDETVSRQLSSFFFFFLKPKFFITYSKYYTIYVDNGSISSNTGVNGSVYVYNIINRNALQISYSTAHRYTPVILSILKLFLLLFFFFSTYIVHV